MRALDLDVPQRRRRQDQADTDKQRLKTLANLWANQATCTSYKHTPLTQFAILAHRSETIKSKVISDFVRSISPNFEILTGADTKSALLSLLAPM